MGETLRKKRAVPSKRPILPSKDYSYAERRLSSHPTGLYSLKEGKGRRGHIILSGPT